jgi:uncharacterized membrane protein YbhN (UPF0104 family)
MAADDALTPAAGDGDPGTPGDTTAPVPPVAPGATAVEGEDPTTTAGAQASAGAPTTMPSRRTALIRAGAILAILFVVFGLILPRFVDYEEVFKALAALTPPQILVMTILGIIAWFVCGQLFTVLMDGITPLRGMESYLILSGIGSSIPFGPWNMGVVWVVFRGWGISFRDSTSGIALYGIINSLGRFALPVIAIIVIGATGGLSGERPWAVIISVISGVIFFVAAGIMLAVVQSDKMADWVAHKVEAVTFWILRKLGRKELPDVDGAIHRFRDGVGAIVHRRGLAALGVTIAAQVPWCIAFVTALRFTGVPADVLNAGEIIGVFALVAVITFIPIAPGGAGVPELLYIAGLSAIAGEQWEAAITAGVFLFRLYVWFLPIPLAWILLKLARRGRSTLPTTTEVKTYVTT